MLNKKYKSFKFEKESFDLILNQNNLDFKIDRLLSKVKNKNNIQNIVIILAISLFISSNPTSTFALSSLNSFKDNGFKIVNEIRDIIIQGVIITTALRLLYEYTQGANDYRIFDVLKESIGIIAILLILPKIPDIFNSFIK